MDSTATPVPTLRDLGYLKPDEVGALLAAKPATLSNWRSAGIGPPFTKVHGNQVVYPMAGVTKWLAERTTSPGRAATLVEGAKRANRRGKTGAAQSGR